MEERVLLADRVREGKARGRPACDATAGLGVGLGFGVGAGVGGGVGGGGGGGGKRGGL